MAKWQRGKQGKEAKIKEAKRQRGKDQRGKEAKIEEVKTKEAYASRHRGIEHGAAESPPPPLLTPPPRESRPLRVPAGPVFEGFERMPLQDVYGEYTPRSGAPQQPPSRSPTPPPDTPPTEMAPERTVTSRWRDQSNRCYRACSVLLAHVLLAAVSRSA